MVTSNGKSFAVADIGATTLLSHKGLRRPALLTLEIVVTPPRSGGCALQELRSVMTSTEALASMPAEWGQEYFGLAVPSVKRSAILVFPFSRYQFETSRLTTRGWRCLGVAT